MYRLLCPFSYENLDVICKSPYNTYKAIQYPCLSLVSAIFLCFYTRIVLRVLSSNLSWYSSRE